MKKTAYPGYINTHVGPSLIEEESVNPYIKLHNSLMQGHDHGPENPYDGVSIVVVGVGAIFTHAHAKLNMVGHMI